MNWNELNPNGCELFVTKMKKRKVNVSKKRQIQPIHAGPLFKRLHVVDEQLNNVKTEERNQSLMRHAREKETRTNDYFMIFSLECGILIRKTVEMLISFSYFCLPHFSWPTKMKQKWQNALNSYHECIRISMVSVFVFFFSLLSSSRTKMQ